MATENNAAFTAVSRGQTLAARVISQLEEMILSQKLAPGHRLPPERELSEQFGVSRTVVREALGQLRAKSWLENASGGGFLVRLPDQSGLSQSMTLLLKAGELQLPHALVLEVRRGLEIEIAGHAATRRTDADLQEMETILATMQSLAGTQKDDELEVIMQNDLAFHAALAGATHNPLWRVLLDSVAEILLAVRRLGMRDVRSHQNALFHHGAILEAVRNGDSHAARNAMSAHLDESERTMKRAALQLEQ